MIALIYPLAVMLIAIPMASEHWGWAWVLLPFNIVVVPAIDHLVRTAAPNCCVPLWFRRVNYSRAAFWIYGAAQTAAVIVTLFQVTATEPSLPVLLGWASSVGIMTGTAGITAAHELIHRRSKAERALGVYLLAMTTYAHFRIEHVLGHHKTFGTDRDSSSAQVGDSYPSFLGRTLRNGLRSAWALECEHLVNRGLPTWSIRNRMLQYAGLQATIWAAVWTAVGPPGLLLMALQSFVAVHLLEAVNYVQHYGLRRRVDAMGKPRRPTAADSWDSDDPVSTLLVFNLSTHSAHHVRPGEPCEHLRAEIGAPRLPASFFLMVFVALIPPLWHRMMDLRAKAAALPRRGNGGSEHALEGTAS